MAFSRGEIAERHPEAATDIRFSNHTTEMKARWSDLALRPAPPIFVSHAFEAEALQFVRAPAGWVGEHIYPPERQFFFCLQGHLEVRASDGEKRTLGPGDVMLMEDSSVKGHSLRVTGIKDLIAAIVSVE
jgi:quercetin dioxygenase-like cupin family protein